MSKVTGLLLIIAPAIIIADSQRGDWFDVYQSDTWSHDTPVDTLHLPGGSQYSTSGQWHSAYKADKRKEVTKKEDAGIFGKLKSELSGVGKKLVGGFSKLTGGAIPVAEDRSADPFIDFDLDFNIGHPKLGYFGNGFHMRASDGGQEEADRANRNSDLSVEASNLHYPTAYTHYQTSFTPSNPRPVRDSPAADYYEYQEPSHQSYIPVNQPETSYEDPNYSYETPTSGYDATSYYSPESSYTQESSPNYDAPPYSAPSYDTTGNYYEAVTKPPLHVKIRQDLDNLMEGIVAPIKNLMPGKKTHSAASTQSYQLVPAGENNHLDSSYQGDVINRDETTGESSSGLFPTVFGKPPLMEKIRQDFFSWMPKAKRETKYYIPPSQPLPQQQQQPLQAYPATAAPVQPPALPPKQQFVRQAPYPTQAPSFILGDGQQLFKIIPVQNNGATLYQIVPTTSPQTFQPSASTSYNTYTTGEQEYYAQAQSAPTPSVATSHKPRQEGNIFTRIVNDLSNNQVDPRTRGSRKLETDSLGSNSESVVVVSVPESSESNLAEIDPETEFHTYQVEITQGQEEPSEVLGEIITENYDIIDDQQLGEDGSRFP